MLERASKLTVLDVIASPFAYVAEYGFQTCCTGAFGYVTEAISPRDVYAIAAWCSVVDPAL
jgi:hypothetical protein